MSEKSIGLTLNNSRADRPLIYSFNILRSAAKLDSIRFDWTIHFKRTSVSGNFPNARIFGFHCNKLTITKQINPFKKKCEG